MKPIRLLDLGLVSPLRSQTIYHAAANALAPGSPNTIILVSPNAPYVCVGYHQDLRKEVDVDYCEAHDLPVYRREVGGGAVYLDSNQLFVQWVFHGEDLPASLEARYARYIAPIVATYQALGVPAYQRPVNDIHVGGKKIGGTGAAQIGDALVLVGSLMLDFDKATMARVLKVPSEKMRDKVFESLEQYMTTLKEQLGQAPHRQTVKSLYLQQASETLGAPIVASALSEAETAWAARLDATFVSDEWLLQKGGLRPQGVKIQEDVQVGEAAFKAPGGLVRATVRTRGGLIDDLVLSGDFTLLPASALGEIETGLRGEPCSLGPLTAKVQAIYEALGVQAPGLEPQHLATAITTAAGVHG